MNTTNTSSTGGPFDPFGITRPAPVLMFYYLLCSFLAGPGFLFALVPLACKYITLRYKFDDKGISTSYGVLFKRETLLTYRRIQDIHLTHNIVQRWLGLATIGIQTASGAAGAEMSLEGILEAEALRDFLYERMRGAKGLDHDESPATAAASVTNQHTTEQHAASDEATVLLRDIRDALVALAKRREAQS